MPQEEMATHLTFGMFHSSFFEKIEVTLRISCHFRLAIIEEAGVNADNDENSAPSAVSITIPSATIASAQSQNSPQRENSVWKQC
jgi:hypothetical protein